MLAHLSVNNFAIVKSLQLELPTGMTTITGETGAGKSIAIDALGLCLGGRADASMVRQGEEKTEVSAAFTQKIISMQRAGLKIMTYLMVTTVSCAESSVKRAAQGLLLMAALFLCHSLKVSGNY